MLGTLAITGGSLYIGLKLYNSSRGAFDKMADWWRERRSGFAASEEVEVKVNSSQGNQSREAIEQGLILSSLCLGLATAGWLFYGPLSIVTIPALLYLGVSPAKEAVRSLIHGRANIALLDTVILAVCLVQGYYLASSLLFWFDYISQKGLRKTQEKHNHAPKGFLSFSHVLEKAAPSVWVLKEGVEIEVPINRLQADDIVVLHAGELVPVDGMITDGYALIDQHLLTADSEPITPKIGDQVFAGGIVLVGRICVKIERVGEATHQAQIGSILNRAASGKSNLQIRIEKVTQQMALPMLCLGSMASFVLGPMGALAIMATRLGYDRVAPLGMATLLEQAQQSGILIRDGHVVEWLSQVDIVVIDHQVAVDALELISQLRERHVKSIYIFSRDQTLKKQAAMCYTASSKVIKGCFTETLPADKARVIEQLKAEGESVCYIGHEIVAAIQNVANVSISVGGISSVARDSADIILLDGTLNQLGTLFDLAKRFEINRKTTFMMTLLPAMVAITGPFLFHSALITTIVLNQIGLLIGVTRSGQLAITEP